MKGKKKTPLTNEQLLKHFSNNFSLALQAINVAKHNMESGKDFHLGSLLEETAREEDLKHEAQEE